MNEPTQPAPPAKKKRRRSGEDLTGEEFGLWKVEVSYPAYRLHGRTLRLLRCLCRGCNRHFDVSLGSLNGGSRGCRSCRSGRGCKKKTPSLRTFRLTGAVFGLLRVIGRGEQKLHALCECACGRRVEVRLAKLRRPSRRGIPRYCLDPSHEIPDELWPRSDLRITLHGRTRTIRQWSQETGLDLGTLYSRVRLGWTAEKILTTPGRKLRRAGVTTPGRVVFAPGWLPE